MVEPGKARRLLFLQYETALGSAVNATPVYAALKRFQPNSTIAVASAGVGHSVLKHDPNIDWLIKTADPHKNFATVAYQLRKALSGIEKFDCVITNVGNTKTRIALLGLISGARMQVGYTLAPELYSATLEPNSESSVLANNLRLLGMLGGEAETLEPTVFFPEHVLAPLDAMLSKNGLADARPLIVFVTQTSGGQPTKWYDDRFASLADSLVNRYGAKIAFVGTAKEAEGIDKIRAEMVHESANLAGETDIPMLSALLCRSDLVVTLDTGTMHLARATSVPTVIIASAWQPAHEWLPLGSKHCKILRRNIMRCPDCRHLVCRTRVCMDEIGAKDVAEAIDMMFDKYPPSIVERWRRIERSCNRRSDVSTNVLSHQDCAPDEPGIGIARPRSLAR